MQISRGQFRTLHSAPELCRYNVVGLRGLDGAVLHGGFTNLRLRLVAGESLSDMLLQATSQEGPRTQLIATTKLMSRL